MKPEINFKDVKGHLEVSVGCLRRSVREESRRCPEVRVFMSDGERCPRMCMMVGREGKR